MKLAMFDRFKATMAAALMLAVQFGGGKNAISRLVAGRALMRGMGERPIPIGEWLQRWMVDAYTGRGRSPFEHGFARAVPRAGIRVSTYGQKQRRAAIPKLGHVSHHKITRKIERIVKRDPRAAEYRGEIREALTRAKLEGRVTAWMAA